MSILGWWLGGVIWAACQSPHYRPRLPQSGCLWPSASSVPESLKQMFRGNCEESKLPSQRPVGAHASRGQARARRPPKGS